MGRYTRAGLLKRAIVLFWALWISIVVAMNVGDLLKTIGLLPAGWKLASGNYKAIVKVTKIYGTPQWMDMLLFLGAIGWESVCMMLLWRAWRLYRSGDSLRLRAVYVAFTALFGVFAMFILMDEVFHSFDYEGDHRGIAVLLLCSLLAIQLLPDRADASR